MRQFYVQWNKILPDHRWFKVICMKTNRLASSGTIYEKRIQYELRIQAFRSQIDITIFRDMQLSSHRKYT